ncbi:dolichol-P-glucose transferase [Halobacteriales archaeon QH_8_64_26]|nr:MAG: dolichol-P-glucose transferase [Halobacteriales archaeon QH_8_64_26]
MSSLGIVLPAYRPDVEGLRSYVTALDERLAPEAILIELDAPCPGVVETLEDCPATVAVAERRRGKGRAIAAGFDRLLDEGTSDRFADSTGTARSDDAGGSDPTTDDAPSPIDTLAFFDADASTPPESAAAVVAPVLAGTCDLAVGSRRHPDAEVGRHQTLGRRRLGDGFAWLARRLVEPSLYDYQCGAKAFAADVWRAVREHLREPGFAWDLDCLVCAAALGYEAREVPIAWHDRPRSTVPPARTALALVRALYRAHRRTSRSAASAGRIRPVAGTDSTERPPSDRDAGR